MLRNEVTRNGMQSHCKKGTSDKVEQGFSSKEVIHEKVKGELNRNVNELQHPWWFRVCDHGSQGIEEGLEENPAKLAKGVAKQLGFQQRWNVRIIYFIPLILLTDIYFFIFKDIRVHHVSGGQYKI